MTGFEAVVSQQQRRVHSFARYLLGQTEEAEDVTQEVFLKLWQSFDKIELETVGGWLLRVTRNACYDRLRKRQTLSRILAVESEPESVERSASDIPGPAHYAEAADFRRHLLTALRQLGEPYASVLILREIQGLPYSDICAALEIPLSTVKITLHRGRKRLRQQLGEIYCDAQTA